MKPVDVKSSTYIDYNKGKNKEDLKFELCNHLRISKNENIFAKGYTPNWSEQVFVTKKVKNTVLWTYVISDFNCEKITGTFYEKELQKTNQKEFIVEKVIKRKDNKLYVEWKRTNNYFNSWIDKKGNSSINE